VREYSKLGGYLSPSIGIKFSDVPNGLVAFSKVPLAGWLQIVAFCGLIERHRLHLHAAEEHRPEEGRLNDQRGGRAL